MRVLPLAFLPKKISSSFLFFIDSNGMMMVYKEKKTKKSWTKIAWRFSISGHLFHGCSSEQRRPPKNDCKNRDFTRVSCNQVTCVKTSFFSPIFQRLEEIMVISCQQTKNAKNEIAAEVFQSICSRFGSYQKQRMNRGIPALWLIIDRWLRDAMTTESLLLRCFCAALILFMMCDACQQLFPLGW